MPALKLQILSYSLAVCRQAADEAVPAWVFALPFYSITRTEDELSLILPETALPEDFSGCADRAWRAFKVLGPLDFSLVGVLSGLSTAVANAGVPLFALSTFDTDYLLVQGENLARARAALVGSGYVVEGA
jgi:hypothetical protein